MPKKALPSYRLHKRSGLAVVTLNGKDFYLGKYKSKASWDEYYRLTGEYISNGRKLPPTRGNGSGIFIQELVIRFLEWAESYYRKNGKITYTFSHCKLALSPLVQYYGNKTVADFGPLSLVFIRDQWVKAGTSRQTINRWINIIRQAFRWAVAEVSVLSAFVNMMDSPMMKKWLLAV